MRVRALALSMGIVTFLVVASWLYLEVNGWHIGAWCSSVDNCSMAPDLTGIALAAAVSGLVVVVGVILVGQARGAARQVNADPFRD